MASKKFDQYILPAVAIAIAGFFGYDFYKRKKAKELAEKSESEQPTIPAVDPNTKQTGVKSSVASSKVLSDLQNALIQYFIAFPDKAKQLTNKQYTTAEAKGGFGTLSREALTVAVGSSNYNSSKTITDTFAKQMIGIIERDLAQNAESKKQAKTKQTELQKLKDLAKAIVKLVESGKSEAKLLNNIKAPILQYDQARKTYITLNRDGQQFKGRIYKKGDLIDRQNGQILIKLSSLQRLPVSPENLITQSR